MLFPYAMKYVLEWTAQEREVPVESIILVVCKAVRCLIKHTEKLL